MKTHPFNDQNFPNTAERKYVRDSVIFAQGSKTLGLILVVKGIVKLIRHTITGHIVPIHTAVAGETVAEASLFSENYHCDCIAADDCTVRLISKSDILKLLETDTAFNLPFMRHLAEQTIAYRRRIELLTMKGAKEKVMAAIADDVQYGSIIELASHLGLTQEATYRALADLSRVGTLVKVGRGRYEMVATGE